jgi:hypothetical protein
VKSWLSLFLALASPAILVAQTEKPTPKPDATPVAKAGAKNTPKPTTDEDERIKTTLGNLPPNQIFHNVQIPSLGPNGEIQSLFKAETAKRIGDQNMEMQNLQIEIHNPDGTTFHVQMAHSIFDFSTKILTSDTPSTIKRDDFVINGDRAEFNVKTRFGRMLGNVKMTIFNTGNVGNEPKHKKPRPPKAKAAPAAASTPAPTPAPKTQ